MRSSARFPCLDERSRDHSPPCGVTAASQGSRRGKLSSPREQPGPVRPADGAQPVVAETEAARARRAARRTRTGCSGSRSPARRGRPGHRGAAMVPGPSRPPSSSMNGVPTIVVSRWTLGYCRASAMCASISGNPQCAITAVSRGCRASTVAHRPGTGVRAGHRTAAAVHDHRHPRLGQLTPHRVEQRVARVVPADLDVGLEHPRPGVQGRAHVGSAAGLGIERPGRDAARACARRTRAPTARASRPCRACADRPAP